MHALRIGPGPATTGPHTPAVTCTQPSHTRQEGFRHEASVHGWQREWGSRSLQVARRRLRHPAPQLFRVLTSNDQETNFSWGSHPSSKLHPQRPHQSADRRSQTHSVRSRSRLDTRFVRRIRAERGVLYLPWECNRELRALRACNKHAAQRNECDATCRPQRQRPWRR